MALKEEFINNSTLRSDQLQNEVGYHLKRAYVHMIEEFHLHMSEFRLRPGEFSILCIIEENDDVTARQLSQALNIAPPNLVSLVENLCERNLIKKTVNEQDRRAQLLTLTNAGSTLLKNAKNASKEAQAKGLKNLSENEKENLVLILKKLYQ